MPRTELPGRPPSPAARPLAARRRASWVAAARLATAGALLLAAPVEALAINRCTNPQEQQSFEIMALQQDLTVYALICRSPANDDLYGAFVQRFRPQLIEANAGFRRFFTRAHGRGATTSADAYMTSLANGRQQEASKLGSDFCLRNRILFDEVAALSGPADLAAYAAGKDVVPASLGACEPPPAPRGRTAARAHGR